jgi:hypothetical protein
MVAGDVDTGAVFIGRALKFNPSLASAWYVNGWIELLDGFTAEPVRPASVLACELPLPPPRGQAAVHVSSDGYAEDDRGVWRCPSADGAQDLGKTGGMSFWAHRTWRCPFSAGIINIHLRNSRRHTNQEAQSRDAEGFTSLTRTLLP